MTDWKLCFDQHINFDGSSDAQSFVGQVPSKWVVYLLTDATDQPVQLLCVKNLRASLKRRLFGDELVGPSRRVNYRDLVRRIYWRRVDSDFEADWLYLELARQIFPGTYRGMVGFEPAWFVHVNPGTAFPRFVKTIDLTKKGELLGPLADKHVAARFIEHVEDVFDLCRYYNILVEAPHARACAYKEMGKCPAPCDGSISMANYRRMIATSVQVAVSPDHAVEEHRQRMTDAARELRFESAGKIKQHIDQLSQFGSGSFRHVRKLQDFRYLSLQHGPRAGLAKAFVISPGQVEEAVGLINAPLHPAETLAELLKIAQKPADCSQSGMERIGVVASHLFRAKRASGVYLPLAEVNEKSFAKAWRELQKQKTGEETDDEGVVKELNVMDQESVNQSGM